MKIAIVGGGIGGLTAALALSQNPYDITVFERSAGIREIGAGVQISPNAGRLLHSLGLGAAYSEISVNPHRVVLRRWEDDSIIRATDLETLVGICACLEQDSRNVMIAPISG